MFHRILNIPTSRSFFLFGARGTGKSTLLREHFPKASTMWVDLLDPEVEQAFAIEPGRLRRQVLALESDYSHVVIDEIQKVPALLDVVHGLIENDRVPQHFVLTGSSARKLKAGGANLLAGRAVVRQLFPLFDSEINGGQDIESTLRWGSLPRIVTGPEEGRDDELRAYAFTYLKEEVLAEQLIRKLDPFRKFLQIAAQSNAKIINFAKISAQVGVDAKTVRSYYSILEDTLIGFFLESWHSSVRKRLRQAPKFYFFDPGVVRALAQQLRVLPLPSTSYFGELFEQHVIREIVHRNASLNLDMQFGYLLTDRDVEIDLVVQRPSLPLCLVEIKSTDRVSEHDASALIQFSQDFPGAQCLLLSRDPVAQMIGTVRAVPWRQGIDELTKI
jgi:predicted AAA+ superfamily ATPase